MTQLNLIVLIIIFNQNVVFLRDTLTICASHNKTVYGTTYWSFFIFIIDSTVPLLVKEMVWATETGCYRLWSSLSTRLHLRWTVKSDPNHDKECIWEFPRLGQNCSRCESANYTWLILHNPAQPWIMDTAVYADGLHFYSKMRKCQGDTVTMIFICRFIAYISHSMTISTVNTEFISKRSSSV